jgi:hypothetical protein
MRVAAKKAADDVKNKAVFQSAVVFDKEDEAIMRHKFEAQERAIANTFE